MKEDGGVIWLGLGLMQKEGFTVAVDPTIQLQRSSNLPKAAVQQLECKFPLGLTYYRQPANSIAK